METEVKKDSEASIEPASVPVEKKAVANPSPLGLLAFGMTTVLLNLHNAGITGLSIVIAAMGFALGGLAQIIAGIREFKNGNTFGAADCRQSTARWGK